MIRHAVLPVPILAVIPVIAAAMIPVRPERQKTIPVPMLLRPSAVRAATGVKTVRPARPTGTVLMSGLPNAEAAILVPIPVLPAQRAVFPAPETTSPRVFLQPNAVPAVMNADIILIVTLLLNLVIMVVLPQTLAVSALPASPVPTAALQDQLLSLAPAGRRKRLSEQLNAETLVTNARHRPKGISGINLIMNLLAEPVKWRFAEIILIR